MNVLFETDKLRIEHEFENAYLIEKSSGMELMFDDFYGDPKCGLVSKNNDWAVIAGEHVTVWRENTKMTRIDNEDLKWVNDLRWKSGTIIEILTDPWSNNSAIWELDLETLQYLKIRDFKKYQDSEHADKIEW